MNEKRLAKRFQELNIKSGSQVRGLNIKYVFTPGSGEGRRIKHKKTPSSDIDEDESFLVKIPAKS